MDVQWFVGIPIFLLESAVRGVVKGKEADLM